MICCWSIYVHVILDWSNYHAWRVSVQEGEVSFLKFSINSYLCLSWFISLCHLFVLLQPLRENLLDDIYVYRVWIYLSFMSMELALSTVQIFLLKNMENFNIYKKA